MPIPFRADRPGFDPARRGYHAVYHENEVNRCPGCGRTHWIIGRVSAECGFCATALPLAESMIRDPLWVAHRYRPVQTQAKAA